MSKWHAAGASKHAPDPARWKNVVVCVVEALQRVALQMDIVLADNQRRVNRSDYVLCKHVP